MKRKILPAIEFARQQKGGFDIIHYHGDDFLSKGSARRIRTFYGSAMQEARHARKAGRFLYQSLFYCFELISCLRRGIKIGISQTTCDSLPFVSQHIPCGVPLDIYFPGQNKTPFPSIIFIGDLHSRKRGALMVDIFHTHILPRHPSCQLIIIGPESAKGKSIRYAGTVDEQKLVEEYRSAWTYCMASSYEGFGVPAIEAMACGTAVVAINNPGTRDIIKDGHNGLLASDQSFAEKVNHVLADKELRMRIEKNGIQTVQEIYDIAKTTHRYENIYAAQLKRSDA